MSNKIIIFDLIGSETYAPYLRIDHFLDSGLADSIKDCTIIVNHDSIEHYHSYGLDDRIIKIDYKFGDKLELAKLGLIGWHKLLFVNYIYGIYGEKSREKTIFKVELPIGGIQEEVYSSTFLKANKNSETSFGAGSHERIFAMNISPKTVIAIDENYNIGTNIGPAKNIEWLVPTIFVDNTFEIESIKFPIRFDVNARKLTWDEKEKNVGIVIPTVNCLPNLIATLSSLRNSSYKDFNIFIQVVFNGSKKEVIDEFLKYVEFKSNIGYWSSTFYIIEPIVLPENVGYGAGCNRGFEGLPICDFYGFLNDDVIAPSYMLENLVYPLFLHPEIGVIAPVSNNIVNSQKVPIKSTNLVDFLDESAVWAEYHAPLFLNQPVAGPCLFFTREAILKAGLFDQSFGIGNYEDNDLVDRVIDSGFLSVVTYKVLLYHTGQSTFIKEDFDYEKILSENQEKYRSKTEKKLRFRDIYSAPPIPNPF